MVVIAVKVTLSPVQIEVALATMLTVGVSDVAAFTMIVFDVVVAGLAQTSLLVNLIATVSVPEIAATRNESEFVPEFAPFNSH